MPPVTRNKAPASGATSPVLKQSSSTRATRSTSVKPPSTGTTASKSADSKTQLGKSTSTATSTAPAPKPATGTLGRSTANRMSVVLPTPKRSSTATPTNLASNSDKTTTTKGKDKIKDDDKEPIRAFLRIRPAPMNASTNSAPYIHTLSNTAVEMTDPSPSASRFGMRPSLAPASSTTFTFTRVFAPDTLQPEFFASTALPLVKDLLNGENGLAFAYGVTNSGKTWTIQGGSGKGEGGLLPRTLDVLFNSIEGLYADNKWKPAGCSGVEREPNYGPAKTKAIEPDVESLLGAGDSDKDDTVLKVDRNYEYSVFVSYAEVYNEKLFDLLATSSLSPEDMSSSAVSRSNSSQSLSRAAQQPTGASQAKPLPRYLSALLPKSISSHLGFSSSTSSSSLNTGAAWGAGDVPGTLSRKALALKSDQATGGKYISGIREIRVRSAEEGKAILKLGQINRTVFGTMANERSSRSHAVFTIKVLKVHRGADKEDPEEVQCARLSVVDLAGSERSKNTQTTGDRLKEAGNINKSLMVLGQCMEMLRANQRKIAAGATLKLGLVPFRHSKLTELFQDFFVGEGRAVMIVNVNPYDTGFDENSHVMKFSALARDVATTTTRAVTRAPPAAKSSGMASVGRTSSVKALVAAAESRAASSEKTPSAPVRTARKVRISEGTPAETVLEVVEEDEGDPDDDDDDIPRDTLVEELFDEVQWLREKLYEAEMRASMIEIEVREEVTREMEERMQVMERMHSRRLASEVEAGELKTDRKIDMLQRTIQSRQEYDTEEEDNVDKSLMVQMIEQDEEDSEEDEEESEEGGSPSGSPTPRHKQLLTGAPLSTLTEAESIVEETPSVKEEEEEEDFHGDSTMEAAAVLQADVTGGEVSMSVDERSESEEEEVTESEDEAPVRTSRTPSKAAQKQRASSEDEEWQAQDNEDEEEEEEYVPSPPVRAKPAPRSISPTKIPRPASPVKPRTKVQVKEEEEIIVLDKSEDEDEEDESMSTAAIVPNKRLRAARLSASGPKSEYVPSPGEPETVKKKKRQLGKGAALTEDQIWQVAMKAEEQERKASTVRRLGRGSR